MEVENIEFNGMEYEVKGLIEFSSLARLLFNLAKRQKLLENKYVYISESIQDKDQRLSDLETKVLGEPKTYQKKFDEEAFSQRVKPSDYDSSNQNNYGGTNREDDGLDSAHDNKNNSDAINKLKRKINEIEERLNDINLKENNDMMPKIRTNQDNIKTSKNKIDELENYYKEISKQLIKFNEEFDQMKVKVEDFNVYDLMKGGPTEPGESGDKGNVDISKALIMNLENKVFKKFSIYDEKIKKSENDLFKGLEEIKTIKGLMDNFKTQNQRNNEKINEIEKNLNDYINKNNKNIEEITNNIEQLEEKLKNGIDISEMKKEFDEKINKLEEELKDLINNTLDSGKQTQTGKTEPRVRMKIDEFDKAIKEIKKNNGELERNLVQNINNVNKTLTEKISLLEKELQKKANSTDLNPINDKLYSLDEYDKELAARIDALYEYNDKFKLELVSLTKKLESLTGDYEKFKTDFERMGLNNKPEFDENDFVSQTTFSDFKREMSLKYEKIRMNYEDLSNSVSDISSSLDQFVNNKDFTLFKNTVLSLLDEFKMNVVKKYMEKHEIQKSLRVLENQIKSLAETYKRNDGENNWLLAKKPLNNYQCASCEANLRDLEKKDIFVAWNKYPNREDKTYRMGHGFSRMLRLVNDEIIRNLESKENKGYVSDEDGKFINNNRSRYNESSSVADSKNIKFPKVNQKNFSKDNCGMTVNKFEMNCLSPYAEKESHLPIEPRVTKIYKLSNKSRKFFKIIGNNEKYDDIPMNMTQPNNKK